ncbi:MAG: 3-isopropylmalate dehydratase, small subunit [Methanomicrobiales archaeon 53_19]|jgi:methanogen homoaconitase small subunit|uniref:LeuD/DmdB family oxidoreductase small subunit n=1 Tax=Methanocalculus sp. TaxID=2004547 RepID=UPI0007493701|nr:3-isopropylmalate dehydratase [Methanocalculus sp.]KUK69430.1 MAG: 3-isopropylmalate dehydratase, small subunit [Methanocalculus sp. 52_23]KUL04426.1 MAG: 3-isopropylmalate dehydratase, small subunit [Methanomicrobiales archaeon 53_19]HIJ06992.1 3-isopropylmalate dehydratase [Methanocalculus sp.]
MITGQAVCLGPDIDTDLIIAGRYLRTKDRSVWGAHVFEDLDPSLAGRLSGAIIVAGRNFGCGSSREQAPVALREAGVVAVISPLFARIFFRNAINVGLPVLEADLTCRDGDQIAINLNEGVIEVAETRYSFTPLSPRMRDILDAGGLVTYWRGKA